MKKIFMFAGGIGSGKMHVCLQKAGEVKELGNRVAMVSFADPLKQLCGMMFGFDKNGNTVPKIITTSLDKAIEFIQSSIDVKNTPKFDILKYQWLENRFDAILQNFTDAEDEPTEDDAKELRKKAMRQALQFIGTDVAHAIDKEVWPTIGMETTEEFLEIADCVFIDDWRFMMEFSHVFRQSQHKYEVIPYFVDASKETRAERRGISVYELDQQSQHASEREGQEVIKPFMQIYYPQNIIWNDKDGL